MFGICLSFTHLPHKPSILLEHFHERNFTGAALKTFTVLHSRNLCSPCPHSCGPSGVSDWLAECRQYVYTTPGRDFVKGKYINEKKFLVNHGCSNCPILINIEGCSNYSAPYNTSHLVHCSCWRATTPFSGHFIALIPLLYKLNYKTVQITILGVSPKIPPRHQTFNPRSNSQYYKVISNFIYQTFNEYFQNFLSKKVLFWLLLLW